MIRGFSSLIKGFYGRSSKMAESVAESVAANAAKGTTVRTDLATGTTFMERTYKGNLYKVEESVLPNGAKQTTTRVYSCNGDGIGKGGDEGLAVFREKQISRQKGASILGGDRIEINKQYHETMGMTAYSQNITKDYDANSVLQHMEGSLRYSHWENPKTASMDRTFAEVPLPHSAEILFNPKAAAHTNYKHSVSDIWANNVHYSGYSNHGKFATEGTTYSRAIDAQKAKAAEKAAEVEAAKAAVLKAEAEAAKKLAASRPKVNTGKVFNKNIEEFKCVEEVKPDGSIIRRYFDPYASNSKSNPMITTIDKGNYHEEIIYDPRKGIKLTYKQLGNKEPYIEMQKGWRYRYTSTYHERTNYREELQQYNDGQNIVQSYGKDNYSPTHIVTKNPHSPELQAQRGESEYITNSTPFYTYEQSKALSKRYEEIKQDMVHNEVDLMDLFKPYKP